MIVTYGGLDSAIAAVLDATSFVHHVLFKGQHSFLLFGSPVAELVVSHLVVGVHLFFHQVVGDLPLVLAHLEFSLVGVIFALR